MTGFCHLQLMNIFSLFLLEFTVAKPPLPKDLATFTLSSIWDMTIPVLHPIVEAGSSKCEFVKSFLGVTYQQMEEKNASGLYKPINIDLVTNKGNIKYNLTRRVAKMLSSSGDNVIILIHGFLESSDGWMVNAVGPQFLRRKNYTVLALDGRNIMTVDYFRSSSYAKFMGVKLGSLITQMIASGHDAKKITLIGHSLGAHIAGIAGKHVKEKTGIKLGRITGLDPAGPCFTTASQDEKLDRSDAEYVDVIHTNGGMLGIKEPVGHKDFFPNSGLVQPGCYISTCDHSRAWELYAETVNRPRDFPARKCDNWPMFRDGNCSNSEVAYMGLQSEAGSPGNYYLTTTSSAPFSASVASVGK